MRRERSSHKCRSCREKSVDDQVDLEGLEARGQLLWSDGPCSWVPGRILCVRKRHRNDWGVCKCWGQYEDAGAYTLTRIGGNRADLTEPTRWSTLTHAFRALSGPDHRTPGGRSCSTLMIRRFFASGHRVQARQCAPLKGATGADRINTEFSAWHSLVRGLGFDTFCARVNGRRSAGRSPNGTSRFRERVCGCRTGVGSRSERSQATRRLMRSLSTTNSGPSVTSIEMRPMFRWRMMRMAPLREFAQSGELTLSVKERVHGLSHALRPCDAGVCFRLSVDFGLPIFTDGTVWLWLTPERVLERITARVQV